MSKKKTKYKKLKSFIQTKYNKKSKSTSLSGKIGYFGTYLIFQLKYDDNDKIKGYTFENFKRELSANTENESVLGKKPKTEFLNPDLVSITFDVYFSAECGINVRKQLDNLRKCIENGCVDYLVVGGEKVGKNKFIIKSASEAWNTILSHGELVEATVSLTMEEYV